METIEAKIDDFHIDLLKRQPYEMPHIHFHKCYELFILFDGEVEMVIQDKVYQGSAGNVLLVPAEHFHRTVCKRKCTRVVINFSYEYLNLFYSRKTIAEMLKCFDLTFIQLDKEVSATIFKLSNDVIDAENDGIRMLRLGEILYTLCENMNYDLSEKDNSPSLMLASDILSFINDNYKSLFEIGEIADKFYISREHLCRLFKKYTGLTVISYINSCKLKSAQRMLKETKKSIVEISDECGFSTPSYFSKVFKRNYQISPLDFRKVNS